MTLRAVAALSSVTIALVAGVSGWVAVDNVAVQASDSLTDVRQVLIATEATLRNTEAITSATADALDAASVSLTAASRTSAATGEVAVEVADVTDTLVPVVDGLVGTLSDLDQSLDGVDAALDALPFNVGVQVGSNRIGPLTEDLAPLIADLEAAGEALGGLSLEAETLALRTELLADELSLVAASLRSSEADILALADEVGQAALDVTERDGGLTVDLLPVRVLLISLSLAIVVGQLPHLLGARLDRSLVR